MIDIQAAQESARPIFNWDALKGIGPHDLGYKTSVKGKIYEVS
jgi:hypothetical protein